MLYFTVTDARSATYEIATPLQAIEQLTVTTLRNVIGGLTLEATLTARENVNTELRTVLDEATGKWGIRINRVEIKSVDPPSDIKTAMEKQMRAERDRRAAILTAEGEKQAQILTAEGEKQSAVLTAEGARQAAILRAEGEAKAIATVFDAIHKGDADKKLLSYQYLQMLPELARGDANKVFVIPSEFTHAFAELGEALAHRVSVPSTNGSPPAGNETTFAGNESTSSRRRQRIDVRRQRIDVRRQRIDVRRQRIDTRGRRTGGQHRPRVQHLTRPVGSDRPGRQNIAPGQAKPSPEGESVGRPGQTAAPRGEPPLVAATR